jgi:hypothetical protein
MPNKLPQPKTHRPPCRVLYSDGTRCCICNDHMCESTVADSYQDFKICIECQQEEKVFELIDNVKKEMKNFPILGIFTEIFYRMFLFDPLEIVIYDKKKDKYLAEKDNKKRQKIINNKLKKYKT